MISLQARDPVAQWVLLDVPGTAQAAARLRREFAHARGYWLFEGTEWHAVREHGPLLVDLRTCPVLADLCFSEPEAWRGLLMVSEAPSLPLLEHLRRMLTVTFGLHHRALLSYYNPHTASYFFDACDALELSRWLGPIRQLCWFGGTWADQAIGSQGWQQLHNPGLAVSPLAIEENLSAGQREKLQTCVLEQHACHWSRSTGTDYAALWSHLQEGLAQGFSERTVLDDWLWLRLQYPQAELMQSLPGQTPLERLERLRIGWQNDQPRT